MAREPMKQKDALRRQPDGSIIKVWIRRCEHCRCWFGTPWYRDTFCSQACEDADKRWQAKINGQKARIIKKGGADA